MDKYPITYCGIEPGRDCTHVAHMFKQQHLLNGAEEAPEDWSAVNLNNTLYCEIKVLKHVCIDTKKLMAIILNHVLYLLMHIRTNNTFNAQDMPVLSPSRHDSPHGGGTTCTKVHGYCDQANPEEDWSRWYMF